MLDAFYGFLAVCGSMGLATALMYWQRDKPVDVRGISGLGFTAVHLFGTLILAAVIWSAGLVTRPLPFALSMLCFYWLSLIVLVLSIIHWIRRGFAVATRDAENSRLHNES